MSVAIKVENLSKKYIIGHQKQERYIALRDVITNNVRRLGSRLLHPFAGRALQDSPYREELWALKDINLEINQGEHMGIIGRNGAGKTTVLKVLSRITEPTEGRIFIKGRVNGKPRLEAADKVNPDTIKLFFKYLRIQEKTKNDKISDIMDLYSKIDTWFLIMGRLEDTADLILKRFL